MKAILSLAVGLALSISIGDADAAATKTSVAQDHRIHHSHVFHVEPQAIITSVISNIRRRSINQLNDDGETTLDIDVSSIRLDDGGVASLMEELMPVLQAKSDEVKDSHSDDGKKQPLLVKITLAMNKITPSGASKLFDALVGDSGDKKDEEIVNGTTTATNGNSTVSKENTGEDDEDGVAESELDDAASTKDEDSTTNTENDEGGTAADESVEDSTKPLVEADAQILVEELDLSFNDVGGHGINPPNAKLLDSARRLFQSEKAAFVPRILTLENCGIGPAFCRSIGRGILNAYESKANGAGTLSCRPSVLRFGGNTAIANAGCVALAAALRMAIVTNESNHVLEDLDLSSCDVGDAGAEALALAISSNPGCLCRLDLSNNKISNAGAKALGRALIDAGRMGYAFDEIVLDNNDIGDDAARVLADALACGSVRSMSLRSCKLQAPGTSAFGQAINSLANRKSFGEYKLDLSGNHFGTNLVKKKKGAAKYAEKATTNIKFIGKTLTSAAKRFGSDAIGLTADSDDDEEIMGGLVDPDEEIDENKIKACGGQAFAGEILRSNQQTKKCDKASISVCMRQCFLDDGAIDALAASIVGATNCNLSFDVRMTNSVEDEVVEALMNTESDSKLLASCAKRHMDFLDRLADSRQRQLEAAEAATSRVHHDLGGSFFDDDDDDMYDAGSDDYDQYDDFF